MTKYSPFLCPPDKRITTPCLCKPLRPKSSSSSQIIWCFQAWGQGSWKICKLYKPVVVATTKGPHVLKACKPNAWAQKFLLQTESSGTQTCKLSGFCIFHEVLLQLLLVWVNDAFHTLIYMEKESTFSIIWINVLNQYTFLLRSFPRGGSNSQRGWKLGTYSIAVLQKLGLSPFLLFYAFKLR